MSVLISLIIAAVFGLWGFHKRLYPSWAFLFNVLVAAYLCIVLTPTFLNAKQAGGLLSILGNWSNAAILLAIFGIYFALSQILSSYYLTNTYCVSFPKFFDDFGGAVLSFAGGYILVNILLFALAVSPLNNHPLTQKYIPDNDGRAVVKAGRYIASFSLQGFDQNILKAIDSIKTLPVIAKKDAADTTPDVKTPPKSVPNKSVPSQTMPLTISPNTPPESNDIQDSNVAPDDYSVKSQTVYAVTPNIQTEPNKIQIPKSTGILDVNTGGTNLPAEQNSVTLPPTNRD